MLIDFIDLSEWKTKKVILKELKKQGIKVDERSLRNCFEKYNDMFRNHEVDSYIAHSPKGYKLTDDTAEIKISATDHLSRAMDQFSKYHKTMKAIGENSNLNFVLRDGKFILIEGENNENL